MSYYDDPELRYSCLSEPIQVLRSHPHSLSLKSQGRYCYIFLYVIGMRLSWLYCLCHISRKPSIKVDNIYSISLRLLLTVVKSILCSVVTTKIICGITTHDTENM